ncbi:hypothetical protein B0H14DRAFT_2559267 [Mycena olivaceomarginata]|nr:hypothetical protein B0H14DRAFT_2559267 [Mycena olivaceomarginata]
MIFGTCREHSEKAGLLIGNSPDAVAENSPATSTPELSALHPRNKRKAAEVECICGKEVRNDQHCALQRSGVGTGFTACVRRPKRGVRHQLDTVVAAHGAFRVRSLLAGCVGKLGSLTKKGIPFSGGGGGVPDFAEKKTSRCSVNLADLFPLA